MTSEIHERVTRQAEAAFRKASETVVRRAALTGTPILIWDQGRIREIAVEELPPSVVEPVTRPSRQPGITSPLPGRPGPGRSAREA